MIDPTREDLIRLLTLNEHEHEYELIEVCKVCGITGEIVEPE